MGAVWRATSAVRPFRSLAAYVAFPSFPEVSARRSSFGRPTLIEPGHFFAFDLVGFIVEVSSEVAEFPLGLYVFGAFGNIATLGGASAECFRV
jgi:hypothetical protein